MNTAPVLVFRIGSLGDTVVALPALHEIRRRHPAQTIILLTNSPVDGGIKAASSTHVLAGMNLVDDSIEYPHLSRSPRRLLTVLQAIRKRRPRLCYFLVHGRSRAQRIRDRVFLHLAGVRRIVGLRAADGRHRAPDGADALWESEALRTLRATGAAQRPLTLEDFALDLRDEERVAAAQALTGGGIAGGYIVISIGSKLKVKDWGNERWIRCLQELGAEAGGTALVAIGSGDESARSQDVLAAWPGRTMNLCGQLTPRQSAAVLERAALFLGHDSGPMHLASAVGTTTIAVFSARAMPGIWFPFGQERNVQFRSLDCAGCGLEVCIEKRMQCIAQIDPIEVAQFAGRKLALGNRSGNARI